MDVFASEDHRQHHALELDRGQLIPSWDGPDRADVVRAALEEAGHSFGEVVELDMGSVARVHEAGYLEFLQSAWSEWVEAGQTSEAAMGFCWPVRRMNAERPPESIHGKLGYYAFAADCSITAGTWPAAAGGAALAQSATTAVQEGARAAFALCRPPGHHASADQFGGYCYLNNAAIAAQQLIDGAMARVSIIDIDYHHGNGTQDIFYERNDVAYMSIHADPKHAFPYFLGHGDESGLGAGAGFNHNEPLPDGTGWEAWAAALDRCLERAVSIGSEALVISVGVDTFENDPISTFKLETGDFPKIGERIEALSLPTVFVFEGGYAVAEIGENVAGVLSGFEAQADLKKAVTPE